ncbi:MAG: phytoene/squalene synthase family protein [Staphylococcus simulans]|uniref:phytoene/squalene synthase family protein n=1 Tax=Staphylococcus TaxID=1279 RepID=UPI0008AA41EE|nr:MULTISPECIES: phytoene/squalene synthase family protein [Staphylococcus]MDK7925847.1 phytoene/squalene synthase family protein [Staphylococcus simulans]MDK8314504.1 phytoene/squalene synthase family protein [Staphylococcus simulans]OHR46958.1 squalene synthase [Staphylococcus sp. HMSC056D08]OHS45058.1 squalene synthase [Staphylococcus sp. HMSC65H10]
MEQLINDDYEYCRKIMEEYSKTFSYAFNSLPEQERKAVWAIYAVCRMIDDSIDEYEDPKRLDAIREDLEHIYDGDSENVNFNSNASVMRAFRHTLKSYPVPLHAFKTLMDYVESDLTMTALETDEELDAYCYGVAGTIGELLTPVLAYEQYYETADKVGIELGKALQITNILRDVGEDFENNRIYLSANRLKEYNVDLKAVYEEGVTQNYIDLWESYAKDADAMYHNALSHLDYFHEDARPIIEVAAQAYREILEVVRKKHYSLHQRAYVSRLKKGQIYRRVMKSYK